MDEWFVEAGGFYTINGQKAFGRKLFYGLDEIDKIRARFNNTDAYASIYMYNDRNQEDSLLYAPLYIDLDINIASEHDFKKIKRDLAHVVTALNTNYKVPYEYIKLYFSGNKGFHIIVPAEVFNITPCIDLNEKYKIIATELRKLTLFKTVDTRIYDRKRLFRLPNSINGKTGLYKVPVDYEFIRQASYQEMVNYASEPRDMEFPEPKIIAEAQRRFNETIEKIKEEEIAATKAQFKGTGKNIIKGTLPCIDKILNSGAPDGSRNNTTVILASSFFQNGATVEECTSRLLKWNLEKNQPKLSDKEIKDTARSAHKGFLEGKKFGCRAIVDLGFCIGKKCALYKK